MARIRTRSVLNVLSCCVMAGALGACASAGSTDEQDERDVGRVLPDLGAAVDAPDTAALDVAIMPDVTVPDVTEADGAADATPSIDAGADATTDVPADTSPDVRPDVTQDTRPDTAQDAGPDTSPDVAPDTTPDVAPDVAPDAAADTVPDAAADTTPDAAPDVTPDTTPDVVPAEICDNEVDDDGDGTVDCGDADCVDDPGCAIVDDPCGPITPAAVGINTAAATTDSVTLTCPPRGGPESVFRFTPAIAGTYCLRTDASATFDTVLEGRFDCADPGTLLGCFDDNEDGSLQAQSDLVAEAGTAYDLIVESFDGDLGDSVTLTIEEGSCVDAGPGFETCTNPFVVSAYDSYSGPAFSDDHVGSCSSPFVSYEAVIEFVAPETTRVCADTFGSTNDTVLWVQSSCDPATEIACQDDAEPGVNFQSTVSWDAVAGESYFVFIEEYESDDFIGEAFFAYNIAACP